VNQPAKREPRHQPLTRVRSAATAGEAGAGGSGRETPCSTAAPRSRPDLTCWCTSQANRYAACRRGGGYAATSTTCTQRRRRRAQTWWSLVVRGTTGVGPVTPVPAASADMVVLGGKTVSSMVHAGCVLWVDPAFNRFTACREFITGMRAGAWFYGSPRSPATCRPTLSEPSQRAGSRQVARTTL